jgi:putative endonuclease
MANARATKAWLGERAENICADYLFARGFTILAHNARAGHLEVDLIARRGPLIVLVEVRTRGARAFQRSLESISIPKRMRLLRAADQLWRRSIRRLPGVERIRIDVAAVDLTESRTSVEYIEGAIAGGFGARN